MEHLYEPLKQFGKVRLNEPMSKRTTFKIGGPATYFITVTESEKLVELLQFLDGEGVKYMLLGGGSNMLVADEGYDGVVIQVQTSGLTINGEIVEADAGVQTAVIARESVKAGLAGFEWGVGVPGTIGGAVRGNAGAMGKDMQDDTLKVSVYQDGEVNEFSNEECAFGYRHSIFKDMPGLIIKVWLQLTPSENIDGMKKALEALKYRNETQPKGVASTGCIFKNVDVSHQSPDIGQKKAEKNRELLIKHFGEENELVQKFLKVGKISAGWLVQEAGMKGAKTGNAEISPVHGNFIVNHGGATAADVLSLIEQAKQKVYTKFGFELEEEIALIA